MLVHFITESKYRLRQIKTKLQKVNISAAQYFLNQKSKYMHKRVDTHLLLQFSRKPDDIYWYLCLLNKKYDDIQHERNSAVVGYYYFQEEMILLKSNQNIYTSNRFLSLFQTQVHMSILVKPLIGAYNTPKRSLQTYPDCHSTYKSDKYDLAVTCCHGMQLHGDSKVQ